ncbi:Lytic transglycosylase, catalytic [Candidatus Sulfotelmatobacter sp. SbA7]|jgi:membrane-bound lytic murein transglycosylase D|nr:Lytic transglycosylase, catalytic [Candidatus Sulfotelmatobacter sp. SbA7]
MRIGKQHLRITGAIAWLLGSLACQSAPHPVALLPEKQASAPALTTPSAAPQSAAAAKPEPTSQPQPEAKPDPAADLIARVEKEYQAGQANYQAGHLEAAKENFDRAFNLLLESPLDVGSDERLQQEFDRLLDGVNGLEMQALEQGDGFSEQKAEPAPIDEANEVTYPVDPSIKAKAEAEVKETHSDLPLMMTDPVAGYINYFSTRGRGTLERALARSGRYEEMIRRILKEEGVPQDLIYLAQAESGFHPLALSRAGARGMWQFMGSRAKGYGLERNWWVDDRQDPEKATRAAARHLKDLYNEFGDWYLAMAAYNSGPGTVQSAVKRTGYADFWQLYKRNVLPKETRNYVPIIIAVTIMAKNPQQYGLEDVVAEKSESYDKVEIDYPVDLRLVAECVDASASTLQELNPSLLRLTTPKNQEFELHLPAGRKDIYLTAIRAIPPDMRVWWRYHSVVPGDTLASVAKAYRSSRKAIAEANGLGEDEKLTTESKLIIPVTPGRHAFGEGEAAYARHVTRYKVRRGDTVESVADNFGVPPAMVRRWNHLKGDSLAGRQVLYVRLPVTPNFDEKRSMDSAKPKSKKTLHAVDRQGAVRHRVEPGETLYSIAKSHNTTVTALKQQNGNLATLKPGMILLIHSGR